VAGVRSGRVRITDALTTESRNEAAVKMNGAAYASVLQA